VEPTGLRHFGSFHVGGREVTLSGRPVTEHVFTAGAPPTRFDPNGEVEVEQVYVQYLVPEPQRSRYPLLMWHGGGMTGVTWDTKPDGGPGWMQYFFRAGHPVYVSDAVGRGRASWPGDPGLVGVRPFLRTKQEAWEMFRIGHRGSYSAVPAERVAIPGVRFPVAAFDRFALQFVPRSTDNDEPTQRGYDALVQEVGECVVMVHSQAGNFGFRAALAAPDLVRAVIAVEPAGAPPPGPALDALREVPMLILWGDNVEDNEVWARQQPASRRFADDLAARGGDVEWLDLPGHGVTGNSHMIMMDTNSDEVADLVQDWMGHKGLMRL
jgi:pimeloyl-ACP methyl ester carboxylesterase